MNEYQKCGTHTHTHRHNGIFSHKKEGNCLIFNVMNELRGHYAKNEISWAQKDKLEAGRWGKWRDDSQRVQSICYAEWTCSGDLICTAWRP